MSVSQANTNDLRDSFEFFEDQLRRQAAAEDPAESETLARRISVRVRLLAERLHLTQIEREVIYIIAALECLPGARAAFSHLIQRGSIRRCSFEDLCVFFANEPENLVELADMFCDTASILRWRLASTVSFDAGQTPEFFSLDPRVRAFLLGGDRPDARIFGFVDWMEAFPSLAAVGLEPDCAATVVALSDRWKTTGANRCAIFYGPPGAGQEDAAAWLAGDIGLAAMNLDCSRLEGVNQNEPLETVRLALRDAALSESVCIVSNADELMNDISSHALRELFLLSEQCAAPVILCSSECEAVDLMRRPPALIKFSALSSAAREQLWREALAAANVSAEESAAKLADLFRFSRRTISATVSLACAQAEAGGSAVFAETRKLAGGALIAASRHISRNRLSRLARRIETNFDWESLVLPANCLGQLRELANQMGGRSRVYEDWQYAAAQTAGRGIHALFAGPPGTGKTMAASVLANTLGLELYRIDLSSIVSKYIGETEKNLSRIFDVAYDSNAVLFFDEADALFGKRSEVKDAHDRYANIETAYLLQKIEEYDGLTILATNLFDNIDEAFRRRMHALIFFPFPGVAERRRLWEAAITSSTPCAPDLDREYLAERLKLNGAGVKSVALRAAFFSAAEEAPLSMRHIMLAAAREFEKEGRPFLEIDFPLHFPREGSAPVTMPI